MITAIGTGIGNRKKRAMAKTKGRFDMTRLRYGRIIIMTERRCGRLPYSHSVANVLFPADDRLGARQKIYIAQPPLYQIKRKKREDTRRRRAVTKILISWVPRT